MQPEMASDTWDILYLISNQIIYLINILAIACINIFLTAVIETQFWNITLILSILFSQLWYHIVYSLVPGQQVVPEYQDVC